VGIQLVWPDASFLLRASERSLDLWLDRRLTYERFRTHLDPTPSRKAPAEFPQALEGWRTIEIEEARHVLEQDGRLPKSASPAEVEQVFVATLHELDRFRPELLTWVFPALEVTDELRNQLDALAASAAEVRTPHGRLDRTDGGQPHSAEIANPEPPEDESSPPRISTRPLVSFYRRLMTQADRSASEGNDARAALKRKAAATFAGRASAGVARSRAGEDLARLVERLQLAVDFPEIERTAWTKHLVAVLDAAPLFRWSQSARLLYDLQKVCMDAERPTFALEPWGWLASLGRRSLKRQLPHQQKLQISKHLKRASRRLPRVRLDPHASEPLAGLLTHAIEQTEVALRHRFRPLIERGLDRALIVPQNLPEQVGFAKTVDELLDSLIEREHITFGDLRDAIARNPVKLPDVASPAAWWSSDRLLRADRQMAVSLEGVYRRAEAYLRWLQRASALAFATRTGRFLTLYLALPFGGAFVALEGIQHLLELFRPWFHGHVPHTAAPGPVLVAGTFVLGMIHSTAFRTGVFRLARHAARGIRWCFKTLPTRILNIPVLRALLENPATRFAWKWLLKPALPVVPLVLLASALDPDPRILWTVAVGGWLIASIANHSRVGRWIEDRLLDLAHELGGRLGLELLPALYRAIMSLFARGVELIEQVMYEVDQWLRFRRGESRLSLAGKAVAVTIWSSVTYVLRFLVNLVAEPQLNPIKHFPVVTVSHKLVAPFLLPLVRPPFLGLPAGFAIFSGVALQFVIPGICGFLLWELKENWKLYAANRPRFLRPVMIGHHGETLPRLLCPGFHSGTIPKAFARLRRASHWQDDRLPDPAVVRIQNDLVSCEHAIRHFFEREVIGYASCVRSLSELGLKLARVDLATNRVQLELIAQNIPAFRLDLTFDRKGNALLGRQSPELVRAGQDPAVARDFGMLLRGMWAISGVAWNACAQSERISPPDLGTLAFSPDGSLARPSDLVPDATPVDPISGESWTAVDQILWTEWVNYWADQMADEPLPESRDDRYLESSKSPAKKSTTTRPALAQSDDPNPLPARAAPGALSP
jgi:hypothetical protein